jgi:hypothetical protein
MEDFRKQIIIESLKKHKGKNNTINSKQISHLIGLENEEDTHSITRKLITKCINEECLPIGANSKGYYWMEDKSELAEYIIELKNRIKGIENRISKIVYNYENT